MFLVRDGLRHSIPSMDSLYRLGIEPEMIINVHPTSWEAQIEVGEPLTD